MQTIEPALSGKQPAPAPKSSWDRSLLRGLITWPQTRGAIDAGMQKRCQEMFGRFAGLLLPGKVLDVGAGTCHTSSLIGEAGHEVTALDIEDISFFEDIKPIVYSGGAFPFSDQSFDTAVLLTMLHHTPDPVDVLREAARVARRLIVIEDVVRGPVHRQMTSAADSILNLEFTGHPHTNKTDTEWLSAFEELGLQVVSRTEQWSFFFMWQVTYVLEPKC